MLGDWNDSMGDSKWDHWLISFIFKSLTFIFKNNMITIVYKMKKVKNVKKKGISLRKNKLCLT